MGLQVKFRHTRFRCYPCRHKESQTVLGENASFYEGIILLQPYKKDSVNSIQYTKKELNMSDIKGWLCSIQTFSIVQDNVRREMLFIPLFV